MRAIQSPLRNPSLDAAAEPAFYPDTIRGVTLLTPDLARLGRFYADLLGLVEHSRAASESMWCTPSSGDDCQGQVTLQLLEDVHATARPPGTTGLFHTAFLFPHRPALAAATRELLRCNQQAPHVPFTVTLARRGGANLVRSHVASDQR